MIYCVEDEKNIRIKTLQLPTIVGLDANLYFRIKIRRHTKWKKQSKFPG